MSAHHDSHEAVLRRALDDNGLRYTEQRSAVFEHLASTESHPTADEVLLAVRPALPAQFVGHGADYTFRCA